MELSNRHYSWGSVGIENIGDGVDDGELDLGGDAAERWGRLVQLYRAAYGRDPSGTERELIEAQLASL